MTEASGMALMMTGHETVMMCITRNLRLTDGCRDHGLVGAMVARGDIAAAAAGMIV